MNVQHKVKSFSKALKGCTCIRPKRNANDKDYNIEILKVVDWAFFPDSIIKIICDIVFSAEGVERTKYRQSFYIDNNLFESHYNFKREMFNIVFEDSIFVIYESNIGKQTLDLL